MTNEEFIDAIKKDEYLIERKQPQDYEIRLFLNEVDFKCPICGKSLQSKNQKKQKEKMFQIAHIYPNSPIKEQYETLLHLERLGNNCESFENKIALCKECHGTQDFHTSEKDYLNLLSKKKKLLTKSALSEVTVSLGLESKIEVVIDEITKLTSEDVEKLVYEPVPLAKKFESNELMLQTKVYSYVLQYFPFVRDAFKRYDGKNNFLFSVLCGQIKACFEKMATVSLDKNMIFKQMVNWLQTKTINKFEDKIQDDFQIACEIIISFFIQDCEVFHVISK